MKFYVVTGLLCRFNAGSRLALTDAQARDRRICLTPDASPTALLKSFCLPNRHLWRVEKTVEFKRGEIVGVDGEVNKALLADLEEAPARTSAKVPAEKGGAGKKGERGKKDSRTAEASPPSEPDELEDEAPEVESESATPPTIPMFGDPEGQTDDEP